MDRRSLIKNTGIAGILAAGVAPAVHAQATLRWRIASSFPKSLDTLFGVADVFAKKVSDMTGGKFVITTHAAGELMPAFGVLDGVSNGTVEMAGTAPYYFFGKDPTYALDCAIPFGLNSRQMTAWMYDGNGLKLMREFYAKVGIVNFPMGNTGVQMGGWFRKEVKTLADMKGLKFRIGGFGGKVLEPLGVVPQNIPGGEIYQALEKGTIDAAEWVGPYEGLSGEYKAIIEGAAAYAHTDMQARYDYRNHDALKTLLSQGAKMHQFPREIMAAAFKSSQQVYSDLSDTNPAWKKIYADYSKYRREANTWFSFAENTMDSFMQKQKL